MRFARTFAVLIAAAGLVGLTVGAALAQLPLSSAPLPQPAAFTPVAALEEGLNLCKQMFATRHPQPPGWHPPPGSIWDQSVATAKARGLSDVSSADLETQGWLVTKIGPSTIPTKRTAWGRVTLRPTPAGCAVELYPDARTELPRPELKSAAEAWVNTTYPTSTHAVAGDRDSSGELIFRTPDGMRVHVGFVNDPGTSGQPLATFAAGSVWVQFIYSPPT